MPLEVVSKELVEIPLPAAGEWVRVRKTFGKADREEIAMRTAARAQVLGIPLDGKNALVLVEGALATLSVAIREWSFDAAITIESTRLLDDDSRAAIFERLAELMPSERTDDDLKNSSAPGQEPLSAEAPTRLNSPGEQ